MQKSYDKLILAVLSGDDYPKIVKDLNEHGIYLTILNSTGGFLKKKSVTVMIGVEAEKLDEVLKILELHAGERMETMYPTNGLELATFPMQVQKGGIIVFVLNIDRAEKY